MFTLIAVIGLILLGLNILVLSTHRTTLKKLTKEASLLEANRPQDNRPASREFRAFETNTVAIAQRAPDDSEATAPSDMLRVHSDLDRFSIDVSIDVHRSENLSAAVLGLVANETGATIGFVSPTLVRIVGSNEKSVVDARKCIDAISGLPPELVVGRDEFRSKDNDPSMYRRRSHIGGPSTGTVKWFNTQKGFGIVHPDFGGDNIFVQIPKDQYPFAYEVEEGGRVVFEVDAEPEAGKILKAHLKF